MRILVVTQKNSGVGYHRLMLPIYFMSKTYALFTDVLSEEALKEGYDIVLINRYIYEEKVERIIELREKYGFKLVVDIDDYWILDPWHILYRFYPTQYIIEHIKIADLVTTTNELLYNELKQFNSNVEILPNALPYGKDQFIEDRTQSDLIRFVYTGSITHEKDIALLRNPLKRVAGTPFSKKSQFVLCGYNPEEKEYMNV
jgi:hypothetical protein